MADKWRKVTATEIAAPIRNALVGGPFGSNLVSADYAEQGVPVIRGQNMGQRWVSGDFAYVDHAKAESLNGNLARPGDIVFTQRGTLGQVSVVPASDFDCYLVSQSQMKLTVNRKIADPLFFYYQFSSEEQLEYIRQNAIQTGVPHTNLGILRKTPVLLPPLCEQRAIAHILGTLDDKIELNRRRNQTLEAMARALFQDWFVDFGPVRGKLEGREPYLPANLWQLFPDRFDGNGKPESWEVQPLSQLLNIIGGGTPKTSVTGYWKGDIPWFSVVDTPPDGDVFVVKTEKAVTVEGLNSSSARLIPKGTTIISARGTVGNLAVAGRDMTFNQSCYGLRGTAGVGDYFVYLTALQMVDQLRSMAHGSVFSTITRQTFEAIQRPVPPSKVLEIFESLVTKWFDGILLNVKQSQTIAQVRDTLLPKLISGELRVVDAEKFIGNAGI
ncbi:restriction endonuclease subunit S [Pseudoxanthomonas wuyuanensis]